MHGFNFFDNTKMTSISLIKIKDTLQLFFSSLLFSIYMLFILLKVVSAVLHHFYGQ